MLKTIDIILKINRNVAYSETKHSKVQKMIGLKKSEYLFSLN